MAEHIPHKLCKRQKSFKDFCIYLDSVNSPSNDDEPFVGVKIVKGSEPDSFEPRIYFPRGYRPDSADSDIKKLDAELKADFFRLISVINDVALQNRFPDNEKSDVKIDFPINAFFSIVQYYQDFGYFVESENVYKKGWSGKISWPRTIKRIKPQVIKDENGKYHVVYLNLITRRTSYKQDNLITLIHKFCVYEAARTVGPLLGITEGEFDTPELEFDYELFADVLKDKIASTFNDKFLELFHSLLTIVNFLGRKENLANDGSDIYFGFKKFDHVWEGMIDRIFGTVVNKGNYDPHLKFVASDVANNAADCAANSTEENLVSDGDTGESLRSTLRPDTIMALDGSVFILDSKYYKYGIRNNKQFLPGAESVCKQMAYAEFVENRMEVLPEKIFNAFIMPYHAENTSQPLGMENKGFIFGDWKNIKGTSADGNRPYHKIACICLDMKSVLRNYSPNSDAQKSLAEMVRTLTGLHNRS